MTLQLTQGVPRQLLQQLPAAVAARYRMFLDDGRKFLLAARKRNKSAHSNYTISSNADDLSLHSDCYLGKCGANMIGTEFVIYDDGIGPGKKTGGTACSGEPGAGCLIW